MNEFCKNYLEIATGELAGLNLTRILEPNEFYEKQYLDSIVPLGKSPSFKKSLESTGLLVDIGFGGGFPILTLKNEIPALKALGLEARSKKAKAVRLISDKLNFKDMNFCHKRVEEIIFDRNCVITFKAVGPIKRCLDLLNIGSSNISVYFYKGPGFDEQEANFKREIGHNWECFEDISYEIGEFQRRFIGIRRKNVPRGTNKSKNLVKVSELL